MSETLSSAAVVIGALRVNDSLGYTEFSLFTVSNNFGHCCRATTRIGPQAKRYWS